MSTPRKLCANCGSCQMRGRPPGLAFCHLLKLTTDVLDVCKLWRPVPEFIRQGAIGEVKEFHTWTNRPVWPQGGAMPEPAPDQKPKDLYWDLYYSWFILMI